MSTIERVINRFQSQLGVTELPFGSNHTPYNDWYFGYRAKAPWCATFLSWCFAHEGLALPATTDKGFAYTPYGAEWFRRQGRWSSVPRVGHVVFYDFPNDGVNRISHVGIVTAVGNGYIDAIEGNTDESGSRTGGKVMARRRSVGIVGYGVPKYAIPPPPPTHGIIVGPSMEVDMQVTPVHVEMPLDNAGKGNITVPYPIDSIIGFLPHSEVRPNFDGRYDDPPNSVTFTPEGNGTVVVCQGGNPLGRAHVWLRVAN